MIEELQRRNFAESTIHSYVHGVEHFSQYFHRRPDRLGPQHIREYQAMLFSKLKYSPNTVISRLAALRFFYIKVLKRHWSIAETPYPRKFIHLPQILSPERASLDPDRYWLHKFRATFATMHLAAGVDLRTVQAWLGHTNLESTIRYLKPARGEAMREKVNATFA